MSSRHSVVRGSLDTGPGKCQMLLQLFYLRLAIWQSHGQELGKEQHSIRPA